MAPLWPLPSRSFAQFLRRLAQRAAARLERLDASSVASSRNLPTAMKSVVSLALFVIAFATPTYAEMVRATWYGNELRGPHTASGEMFNPSGMTAAYKSLRFGTCLVIGNPNTRRKVAVRINERGPFTPGVPLDLPSGAARAIGMRSTQKVTLSRC
jgi:rare lipoprotein A